MRDEAAKLQPQRHGGHCAQVAQEALLERNHSPVAQPLDGRPGAFAELIRGPLDEADEELLKWERLGGNSHAVGRLGLEQRMGRPRLALFLSPAAGEELLESLGPCGKRFAGAEAN